jgi:hypothetical protein
MSGMLFIRDTKLICRIFRTLADFSEQPMYKYPQPQPDLSRSLTPLEGFIYNHSMANIYPTINDAFLVV